MNRILENKLEKKETNLFSSMTHRCCSIHFFNFNVGWDRYGWMSVGCSFILDLIRSTNHYARLSRSRWWSTKNETDGREGWYCLYSNTRWSRNRSTQVLCKFNFIREESGFEELPFRIETIISVEWCRSFQGPGPYDKGIKQTEENGQNILKWVNELSGIKESGTSMALPTPWELAVDK